MKRSDMSRLPSVGLLACLVAAPLGAAAQSAAPAGDAGARLEALKDQLAEQTRRLDALKRAVAEQEAGLDSMRRALGREALAAQRGAGVAPAAGAATPSEAVLQAQAQAPSGPAASSGPTPVGQAPERDAAPKVAPIFEQPGVLTPSGKAIFEPSVQYSYSSSNRIALVGYTVIPALLIGLIDVREVKRNTFTGSITGRYGLSNRFELEAKLPYVYRADTGVGREFLQGAATNSTIFDTRGHGVGDVEVTARYQLNDGGIDKPYYVGSLRFKSRTGKDPFEVVTSKTVLGFRGDGVQTELPSGSGFYGLQPAVTVLYPTDPVVFFGTASYLHTFKRHDVIRNTDEGPEPLGTIEPGGIFGFNFGMGLALNERSSFSIGYDHSSVGRTRQNGLVAPGSVRVQLGTLLLGFSHRLNDKRTLNVSLGAGLTRDSPDMTLTVRMPFTL